ncbi:DNA cytosine methyltransferase [Lactiplantibacillus plantarum]|uniref:DNA cytosine methyltransferase n=1 Tax=Lactiplantibacillus plantarum TaxID=1590 RepID=UPI00280B8A6B|nr:DNA cytosine methyltransferase [Lactiplantibacillus plantarum]
MPESVVLCFLQLQGLLETSKKKIDPAYLLIENVKNLLSINRGKLDFLKLQIELDEIGYDVEWDVLDSAEVVPQHRERIFIVGHLRGRRTRKSISYRQKKRRN